MRWAKFSGNLKEIDPRLRKSILGQTFLTQVWRVYIIVLLLLDVLPDYAWRGPSTPLLMLVMDL